MRKIQESLLTNFAKKYLEAKTKSDYVKLVKMWENLRPIPKDKDPEECKVLIDEINRRMTDIHPFHDKNAPDIHAKLCMCLDSEAYDLVIREFEKTTSSSAYEPVSEAQLKAFCINIIGF